jgi:hypothetical protein
MFCSDDVNAGKLSKKNRIKKEWSVQKDGRLVSHVEEAYSKSSDRVFEGINGVFAASGLLVTMLPDLSPTETPTYFVIDAVNECSGEDQKTLFAQMRRVSSQCRHVR